jgi:hypothetical protein
VRLSYAPTPTRYVTLSADFWDGLGVDPAFNLIPAAKSLAGSVAFDVVKRGYPRLPESWNFNPLAKEGPGRSPGPCRLSGGIPSPG